MSRLKLSVAAMVIGILALAPGAQASQDVLTIYNATNPKLVSKIIDEFKAKNPGLNVDVINAGVGELLTRIRPC